MHDRDSILELFQIIRSEWQKMDLPMASQALSYIEKHLNQGFDIYFRRRLSVCRTLSDLYLSVPMHRLDVMLSATLLHHLPGDHIPEDHEATLRKLFDSNAEIDQIMLYLRHTDYSDLSYYDRLTGDPYALIIRLAERSVLVEKLYEWHPTAAIRYIRETRESFFPLCLYLKETYPEFLGPASILHEKMRNLTTVNEALLSNYLEEEYAIRDEILSLREENAAIRSMIAELEEQV